MTVRKVTTCLGLEKMYKVAQLVFSRHWKQPVNLSVAFVARQPLVAQKEEFFFRLNVPDDDLGQKPGWALARVIVPYTDEC